MENKEIKFIADRYKKGRFSTDKAWNSLGIRPVSIWRKYRVAAAVSAAVVLTASAAIIYKASTAPSISSGTEVTASDLVETINEILGTELTVKNQ